MMIYGISAHMVYSQYIVMRMKFDFLTKKLHKGMSTNAQECNNRWANDRGYPFR